MPSKFLLPKKSKKSTFFLVQSSFGKALPEKSSEDVPKSAKDKLLLDVLGEYTKVADRMLKNGKQLLQDVIADISTQDDKNEQISTRLEEYSKLVFEIEKQQAEGDNVDDINKFKLLYKLFKLIFESITSTDKVFDASLDKNGLNDLLKFLKKIFDEVFSQKFNETADKILNSITTNEWPEKTEIQNWLKQLRNENDVNQKIELFKGFLHLLK